MRRGGWCGAHAPSAPTTTVTATTPTRRSIDHEHESFVADSGRSGSSIANGHQIAEPTARALSPQRSSPGPLRRQLSGTGSSFAAPAIETWVKDVSSAPYNLSVNYTSSNSGDGRYEFTNQTIDFAVSDIGYVGNTDTTPPSFPFNFVPITAGGIAFMYNVPGLTKQLQLSSLHGVRPADRRHQELERSEPSPPTTLV